VKRKETNKKKHQRHSAETFIYIQNRESTIHSSFIATASVVWWSEFLAADPEDPGSITGTTKFSEKQYVLNGVHSAS
jgi:hypothetical protein